MKIIYIIEALSDVKLLQKNANFLYIFIFKTIQNIFRIRHSLYGNYSGSCTVYTYIAGTLFFPHFFLNIICIRYPYLYEKET